MTGEGDISPPRSHEEMDRFCRSQPEGTHCEGLIRSVNAWVPSAIALPGYLGRSLFGQGDVLFLVLLGKSPRGLSHLECSKDSLMTWGWEGPEQNFL